MLHAETAETAGKRARLPTGGLCLDGSPPSCRRVLPPLCSVWVVRCDDPGSAPEGCQKAGSIRSSSAPQSRHDLDEPGRPADLVVGDERWNVLRLADGVTAARVAAENESGRDTFGAPRHAHLVL